MLSLSRTTGYAILAAACIDGPGGVPVPVPYLARCTRIPISYLAKIVRTLAAKGLLKTKRGYRGGVLLARPPEEVTLLELAKAVEGKDLLDTCLLGLPRRWRHLCPMRPFWGRERKRIEAQLRSSTVAALKGLRRRCPLTIAPSHRRPRL